MADLSPAEIMLDQLPPTQRLIKRLQSVLKTHAEVRVPPEARASLAAFCAAVRRDIAKLTAQREEAVALIQQIPDQTARKVLLMHYVDAIPYPKIGRELIYADKTIFRYHRKGVDWLNEIMQNGSN